MKLQMTAAALVAAALAAPASADQARTFVDRIQEVAHARAATVRVERYQRGGGREEQTERFTKTVKIGKDGELDVSNISGDIVVTRGGGGDATIEVVKSARAATAEAAREMLQLVQVDVGERAGRAEIRVNYGEQTGGRGGPWGRWRNSNVSVAFTIKAPEGARVTLKSLSGNIAVKDIKGEVTAESISGHVQIAGGGRVSVAKTMSGDVEIVDAQGQGALEASSASGAVTLRNVKARRLDAQSISGNVLLAGVDCERASVQSMSGDVRYEGPLSRNGRYELKSHSGEVRVAVAGGSGFEVEANTFSGSVRSDFPVQAESAGHPGPHRRSLHGTFGDGSAVLELNTFSGNIAITKK